MYYGLTHPQHAVDMANIVCAVLGNGSNNSANLLLLETAQQETQLGTYRDRTDYSAGFGLTQIDPIGFIDILQRTKPHNKEAILEAFDIDIDQVEHRELEHAPLLSLIFCRLHYKLKPDPIPADVRGRAEYWKTHYNTVKGKGTVEEYLENAERLQETLR